MNSGLIFQVHHNLASITASRTDDDFTGGFFLDAFELLPPLHKHQRILGQEFVEAQRFQLPLTLETIDIEMKQLDGLAMVRAFILVNQCKGRARPLWARRPP